MTPPPLSIIFILGSPDISGGTYVIFEHATRLQRWGHSVSIACEQEVDPARYAWHSHAGELRWLSLAQAGEERFDVAVATWWQSAYQLAALAADHYVYFVQSIEGRFLDPPDPAHNDNRNIAILQQYRDATYGVRLPLITEAGWICDYLKERHNSPSYLVRNGIRKDLYTTAGEAVATRVPGRLRVLVEGPVDVAYKNVPKSIELCRRAGVDEVWLLTSSDIADFPGADRVFSRVPITGCGAIYRSCDVLVKLSYIEGMFGPPLEIFHCGGTAIVYDVTGHDEYIVHGENSYVAARDDEQAVVDFLRRLKDDPAELQRLKDGAAATAASWPDWDEAAAGFARALAEIVTMPVDSRSYLQSWSERCWDEIGRCSMIREFEAFQTREGEGGQPVRLDNFVQLYYWADSEGLRGDQFEWLHYRSGDAVCASLEVVVSGFPFWLRLDPSVRVGVVELDAITLINLRTGKQIRSYRRPWHFNRFQLAGTIRRLKSRSGRHFLSYGDDPQLILPEIREGRDGTQIGDRIAVEVRLRECGMQEFCADQPVGLGGLSWFLVRLLGSSKLARVAGLLRRLLGRS